MYFYQMLRTKILLLCIRMQTEVTFKNGSILYDKNNIGRATDIVPTSQPYSPNSPFTELYGKVIWFFQMRKNYNRGIWCRW